MFAPILAHQSAERLPLLATVRKALHAQKNTFMNALIMLIKAFAATKIVVYRMLTELASFEKLLPYKTLMPTRRDLPIYQATRSSLEATVMMLILTTSKKMR